MTVVELMELTYGCVRSIACLLAIGRSGVCVEEYTYSWLVDVVFCRLMGSINVSGNVNPVVDEMAVPSGEQYPVVMFFDSCVDIGQVGLLVYCCVFFDGYHPVIPVLFESVWDLNFRNLK